MSLNRLIGTLTRQLTNWGVERGIDFYARRSGGVTEEGELSPAARKQAKTARETAKRAKKAARLTRKLR